MAILGAHESIAGGYYKSVEIARRVGCDCVQLFTKNNNQWRAKEISDDDVARFRAALVDCCISHPLAHDSYLINLASPDKALWRKSVDAFVVELVRAERLGIPFVVTHPGAYTTSSESAGIKMIVRALDEVHKQTRGIAAQCLLENTAGQGSCLGWRFEHLAAIIDGVRDPDRVGVCIDTCHTFAAGYDFRTREAYDGLMRKVDETVGLARVHAFHLNDSKGPLGSRVDRHEDIGKGELGKEPFRFLVNDGRFRELPGCLEYPGDDGGYRKNLKVLRSLVTGTTAPEKASKRARHT